MTPPTLIFLPFALLTTAIAVIAQPGALSCGTKGFDIAHPAYYAITNPNLATFAGCKNLCATAATTQKCQAFAIGSGACLLYDASVATILNAVPSSNYTFYDAACTTA
jgi:hypothetical protein